MEVPSKSVTYVDGIPHIQWTMAEVEQMNIKEDLQLAVVGKFAHGWLDMEDLREAIPKQCNIKGRLTLIYDVNFKIDEETTKTMAWISFPNLLPTFFGQESLFAIATAVGKPLQLDQATINKTRPSCAKVRVLVDLAASLPKSVIMKGHDLNNCRLLHNEVVEEAPVDNIQENEESYHPPLVHNLQKGRAKILSSGRIVGDPGAWKVVRDRRGMQNLEQQQLEHHKQQQLVTFNKYRALDNYTTTELGKFSNSKDSIIEVPDATPSDSTNPVEEKMDFNKEHENITNQSLIKENDCDTTPCKQQQETATDMVKSHESDSEQIMGNKEQRPSNFTLEKNMENQQHQEETMNMVIENAICKVAFIESSGQQWQDKDTSTNNMALVEYPTIVAQENEVIVSPMKVLHDIVSHSIGTSPQLQNQQSQWQNCASNTEEVDSHSIGFAPPQAETQQVQQQSNSSSTEEVDSHSLGFVPPQAKTQQSSSTNTVEGSYDEDDKNEAETPIKSNKSGRKGKNNGTSVGNLPIRTRSRRDIVVDAAQHITLKVKDTTSNKTFFATLIYAKCDSGQRVALWEDIYQLYNSMVLPWIIGGDFNVVSNAEEKLGGLDVQPADVDDFANCIGDCDFIEVSFRGSPFTWWNGRAASDCIFERLDRVLINHEFQNWFNHTKVEHLSRTGSDHAPMLLNCEESVNWPVATPDDADNPFFLLQREIKEAKICTHFMEQRRLWCYFQAIDN
ncbi:hypothetical protein KY290_028752 [Solanum tuberosum]|uniref:Endonuclease/exonuclease/phosphatase domain-containing protein n=1 Tax=Solanum tuberosum TaxID=4113 RepID=A0ABQ7UIS7_SOLTU|nr:hypothetical protein KY290_028752 [Solanum tuberosum]